jgi:DNA polymerase III epsilon subunit-like protein
VEPHTAYDQPLPNRPEAFVGDAPPASHNAGFDNTFLNAELTRLAKTPIATERVVDTLVRS